MIWHRCENKAGVVSAHKLHEKSAYVRPTHPNLPWRTQWSDDHVEFHVDADLTCHPSLIKNCQANPGKWQKIAEERRHGQKTQDTSSLGADFKQNKGENCAVNAIYNLVPFEDDVYDKILQRGKVLGLQEVLDLVCPCGITNRKRPELKTWEDLQAQTEGLFVFEIFTRGCIMERH